MSRHSLAPDELLPSERFALRLGAIVAPTARVAWLWFARALLATVIVAIVLCRITGTTDAQLGSTGWRASLATSTLIVCIAFGVLSPYILLPHLFAWSARREGTVLRARTVLGPRSIDLQKARAFFWSIPSNTGTIGFVTLFGLPSGALIVSAQCAEDLGVSARVPVRGHGGAWTRRRIAKPVEWLRRLLVRLVVPSILMLVFCGGVIVGTALAALAR